MGFRLDKQGIISFFPFVALAMLFWVSSIMTKKSTYSKDIFIEVKTGDDHIILDTNIYIANVTLSGKGLDMIMLNSYNKKHPLELNVNKNNPVITPVSIAMQLQSEIPSNKIQIVKVIFPDTPLRIDNKISKKVPVHFAGKISYKINFGHKDQVILKPDKITITCPESWLNEINSWDTEPVEYNDLSSNIKENIKLKQPESNKIIIDPGVVEIIIPVEEYTEKKLVLPVKIIGNKNTNLQIIPSSITVSFLTGVSKYEFIDSTEFLATVYIDQDSILSGNYPVSIVKKPSDVKIQYIQPDFVDVYLK